MKHSTLSSSPNSGNTFVSGIPQRTIKFRAWDKSDGVMYETISFEDMMKMQIMQFTGMLDKLGNEIYEGDVIKYTQHYFNTEMLKEKVKLVQWKNDKWSIYETNAGESDVEVIGNVFQHPELLG